MQCSHPIRFAFLDTNNAQKNILGIFPVEFPLQGYINISLSNSIL